MLLNGRTGVSVEMAIRLSKAFGSTPETLAGDADGVRSLASANRAHGGLNAAEVDRPPTDSENISQLRYRRPG